LLAGREAVGFEPAWVDEDAEEQLSRVIAAVQELRGWRERVGVPPGAAVPARLAAEGYDDVLDVVAERARLELRADGDDPVASVVIPGGTVEVLAGGAFDAEAAQRRLAEQRAKVETEIGRAETKLANEGFVAKAPPEVVQAERDKLERLRKELEEL
jgi:valyl-tRNA synthetase